MAQRSVVPRAFCFPIPDGGDDLTAAALPNPGVSAWLSLTRRAKLAAGETVLILGATGVTGKLAVQIAKLQQTPATRSFTVSFLPHLESAHRVRAKNNRRQPSRIEPGRDPLAEKV